MAKKHKSATILAIFLITSYLLLSMQRRQEYQMMGNNHDKQRFLEVPQIVWGLNNQKIALARALLTARYLNRTLLMPTLSASLFHNSSHPAEPIPFDGVFSLDFFNTNCKGFVSIARVDSVIKDSAEILKGSGRRWTVSRDLQHLQELKSVHADRVLLKIVGKNPFLWPDHWRAADYIRIFSCLRLTDRIMSDAESVANRLSGSYIAVHMRIERDWMIHCKNTENRALQKEGKKLSICSNKEEIINRVAKITSLWRPAVVYLAVADVLLSEDHDSLLQGWGEDLIPYEKRGLGVLETYRKHSYLVQAAMDYEICMRAGVFVGNSFSTFSSLVVLERSIRHPHLCNVSFAYNLVTSQGGARPWRVDLSRGAKLHYESSNVSCVS